MAILLGTGHKWLPECVIDQAPSVVRSTYVRVEG